MKHFQQLAADLQACTNLPSGRHYAQLPYHALEFEKFNGRNTMDILSMRRPIWRLNSIPTGAMVAHRWLNGAKMKGRLPPFT